MTVPDSIDMTVVWPDIEAPISHFDRRFFVQMCESYAGVQKKDYVFNRLIFLQRNCNHYDNYGEQKREELKKMVSIAICKACLNIELSRLFL